jgi:alpha-L-arabinofuranosidase
MKAHLRINKDAATGAIDDRIFGSFIEHLGRAVYSGIYEPGHATADADGFRADVIDAVKTLDVPIVRYPGGNFVSGYRWEDGTGPRDNRPKRLELAWGTIETNEIGIDEFQEWAKKAGTDIMMAVNLGTRGPEEAGNLVEYCNLDTPTPFANKRRENGFEKPFAIKTWCLGNEMDGPWQICHRTAEEYARVACETAKIMKWTDPSIELVACGSSSKFMPTFGTWEETVLRECWEHVDYISLHNYYGNRDNDSGAYLASSLDMDDFIHEVAAICDKIQAEKKSDKKVYLSFDEWNVWFHSNEADKKIKRWSIAPSQLEDIYNLEDALVVGSLINCLLRNADRVKMACLAQLVNVIAPIMTVRGGGLWLQTIYYPYLYASTMGRGTSLKVALESPTYDAGKRAGIPYLDASAVLGDGTLTVFVVNRSLDASVDLDVEALGFGKLVPLERVELTGADLKAGNSPERQDVKPAKREFAAGPVSLPPRSWSMLRWRIA